MKKFKLFMASVLTYFMAMSLLPTSLLQTVASAAENEYSVFVKSDYYLKGSAQYSDEFLIAYGESQRSDTQISIVKNGQETFLKEAKGYDIVEVLSTGDYKAGIVYNKWIDGKLYESYEEFNFSTRKFKQITEEEFNNLKPGKNHDFGESQQIKDKNELNKYLNKFNEKYNLNLNIDGKEYSEELNKWVDQEGNETFVYIQGDFNNKDIKYMNYYEYNSNIGYVNSYTGLIYEGYVYITKHEGYQNFSYDMGNDKSLYIWEKIEGNNYTLIKVKDGKEISKGKINIEDDIFLNLIEIDNKIYINGYVDENHKIYVYELLNDNYKLSNTIDNLAVNYNATKPLLLEKDSNKIYLSQLNNGVASRIIELTSEISSIIDNEYSYFDIREKNGSINIVARNGFIILQKASEDVENKPEVPSKPENPGDNGNNSGSSNNGNQGNNESNVVIKPSEDKVTAEVSKINPNEKNDIAIKTEDGIKNVEVVVKDIESLKNGTGSLNISINNDVKMNLPLSLIDKSLLDGAKDVTIKLDIMENSDIIKNIKAVNKVFDFNLLINKEDGTVNVHNFNDGQAEVTLTLSDKDLEGINKDNILVYYYNEAEKKFEAMETVVNGNEVTFKTSHFSKYVIAEKMEVSKDDSSSTNKNSTGANDTVENKNESGKGQLPETGSRVSSTTVLVLAIVAVAIGGTMSFRKRRHS